jgi:N-acetyl-beta-hexosaminidase
MKIKLYFLLFVFILISPVLSAVNLTDYLIPVPKNVELHEGTFNRNSGRIIIPAISDKEILLRIAGTLQSLLSQLEIKTSIAAAASKDEVPLLRIYLTPELSPQAYRITINPDQILLEGGDEAGLFYALQT